MGVFSVYNSHDSVAAHNLINIQNQDDVFSDIYQNCIARVNVTAAYFKEEYRGPLLLHAPYMEILGSVGSVFLDAKKDSRIFPCGFKELELMDAQHVKIHYALSTEEMVQLVGLGLYNRYGDFDVPTNLVGNVLEVPLTVKYTGVYDSPIAAIEILDPYEVYTCTRENTYYGIFNACVPSKQVEEELLVDFDFCPERRSYTVEQEATYDEPETEVQQEDVFEETAQSTLEDEEDKAVLSAVDKLVQMQTAEDAARRQNVDRKKIASITARANDFQRQKAEAEALERAGSLSDTIFGVDGEDNRNVEQKRAGYDDIKKAVEALDSEHARAEEEAEDSRESARKVDRAIDNQLLNEGIDDISGFNTESEQTLSDAETPEQRKEREDKKSGKAQIDAARRQDIAADNKALNEGNTDIAGHGASNNKPRKPEHVSTAADLIANLSDTAGQSPSTHDDGPQFL